MDGTPLAGFSNQEAVELLRKTGSSVKLSIVRYLRGLKFEELREGISKADITTSASTVAGKSRKQESKVRKKLS